MLLRHRHFFAVLVFMLLATPLVAGVVWPDGPELFLKEKRDPAPAPAAPRTLEAALVFPGAVDAYLKDHFGLRQKMIRLEKDLTSFLRPNQIVVYGKSGRMFALAGDMVMQSAGRVKREDGVAATAKMLATMQSDLAARGIKFLVAMPPNSSTIYPDDLPEWARNPGTTTEYDLMLTELGALGVKAIDLRPALVAARGDGETYLVNDLHWNVRGAIAGFNAVVEGDGHPDWRIDPATAIGPLATRQGGDIATLLGVEDSVSEKTESLTLPTTGETVNLSNGPEGRIGAARDMTDHMIVSGKPGPTILVIGDSFTTGYFPQFLAPRVRRAIWIHHQYCGFDWNWIDKLKPDEVWWTPVERFLVCAPGQSPKNLAANDVSVIRGGAAAPPP
jgi:alginate O-acetyltransferase complex protein AlgJ